MKRLLVYCLFFISIISCKKDKTAYFQQYRITYNQSDNSYIATAAFFQKGTNNLPGLTNGESVTLNDKTSDYQDKYFYTWEGKGKINGSFVLSKKKTEFHNSFSLSDLLDFEISYPDTFYKSEKSVVKLKDRYKHSDYLTINLIHNGGESSTGFLSDSVTYVPEHMKNIPEGPATLRIESRYEHAVENQDQNSGGTINYGTRIDKTIWIAK